MMQVTSLNTVLGNCVTSLPQNDQSKILVVNPSNATAIVTSHTSLENRETLTNHEFAKILAKTARLKNEVENFLSQDNRILVVLLHPFRRILNKQHREIKVSNYDWLKDILDTYHLKFKEIPAASFTVTEYGEDSPFGDYLGKFDHKVTVAAEGHFHPLAIANKQNKAIAFSIQHKNSRIVFLPSFLGIGNQKTLKTALSKASNRESWPPPKPSTEIKPQWLKTYSFPKTKELETKLGEQQKEILRLEQECEKIYHKLSRLEDTQKNILAGSFADTINAISFLFNEWGLKVRRKGHVLRFAKDSFKGVVLTAVCEEKASLWLGEKLVKLCRGEAKGILVVNAHRQLNPKDRPSSIVTDSLENFAQEHNIALISVFDFFQACCLDRKELLDLLWEQSGTVTPPFDLWKPEEEALEETSTEDDSENEEDDSENEDEGEIEEKVLEPEEDGVFEFSEEENGKADSTDDDLDDD